MTTQPSRSYAREAPAETVRRAARLMREHASAATPGPWTYLSRNFIDTGPIDVDEADWGPEGHSGLQVHTHQDTRAWRNADVQHIARWDPAAAAAVAEVLEHVGDDMADNLAEEREVPHHVPAHRWQVGQALITYGPPRRETFEVNYAWTATLALARRYLGEVQS